MAPAWSKGTDNVHSQQSSERATPSNPSTIQQQPNSSSSNINEQQQQQRAAATANCNVFIWKCNLIKVQNVLIAFPFLPCKKQKNNSEKNRREREKETERQGEREKREWTAAKWCNKLMQTMCQLISSLFELFRMILWMENWHYLLSFSW